MGSPTEKASATTTTVATTKKILLSLFNSKEAKNEATSAYNTKSEPQLPAPPAEDSFDASYLKQQIIIITKLGHEQFRHAKDRSYDQLVESFYIHIKKLPDALNSFCKALAEIPKEDIPTSLKENGIECFIANAHFFEKEIKTSLDYFLVDPCNKDGRINTVMNKVISLHNFAPIKNIQTHSQDKQIQEHSGELHKYLLALYILGGNIDSAICKKQVAEFFAKNGSIDLAAKANASGHNPMNIFPDENGAYHFKF